MPRSPRRFCLRGQGAGPADRQTSRRWRRSARRERPPVERVDPFRAGFGLKRSSSFRVERVAFLERESALFVSRLSSARSHQARCTGPPMSAGRSWRFNVAVLGAKDAGRNTGRMVLPGLARHHAIDGSQRAAWKSSMKICASSNEVSTCWPSRMSRARARPQGFHKAATSGGKVGDPCPPRTGPWRDPVTDITRPCLGYLIESRPVADRDRSGRNRDTGIDNARLSARKVA